MQLGLDLGEGEGHGVGVAVGGEGVDPGTAGVAEAEELGDLVEGFAGSVVEGAADEGVGPGGLGGAAEIKVGVAAGDDQGESRLFLVASNSAVILSERSESKDLRLGLSFIQQDGVDVAFEVVDGDEGQPVGEGQGFGVGDADEEGSGEAGTGGDGDGVEIGEGDFSLGNGGADDGDDGAEMLAAGQFGGDTAVTGVGGDLGGYDGREYAGAALNDSGSGLVAGGFDAEDEAAGGHGSSLMGSNVGHRTD